MIFQSTGFAQSANNKSEKRQIEEILMHYIEGTANAEPERLQKAFHPDFNLYSVAKDSLRIWKGQEYIGNFKDGKKSNRIGRILFIDIENDAAIAKVEILLPEKQRNYTDYFLLLKYEDQWKIIHKSFSWKVLNPTDKK
ncbi:nuclear transport factor 2 family protein [Flavobacterium sp. SLB02]|nr:nuclear transport factor 2 family protein [Flavobacterium sp. SLB02]